MKKVLLVGITVIAFSSVAQQLSFTLAGRYTNGNVGACEISTYDATSKKLFVTNAADNTIDIIDLTDVCKDVVASLNGHSSTDAKRSQGQVDSLTESYVSMINVSPLLINVPLVVQIKNLIESLDKKSKMEVSDLSKYLKKNLPDYMMPESWIPLEQFPLTKNGKLDKKALPVPDLEVGLKSEYKVPEGEVETSLVQFWKELLKREKVGTRDNFFELGGQSLLVIRLLSFVKREFGVQMNIGTFFELLTIEELANYINLNQINNLDDTDAYESVTL